MPDVKISRVDGMGARGPLPRKRIEIADWVRREIVVGHLAPGDRLPSRTWFQRRFTPNANVVQRAFAELAADGFVETRGAAARGTVVARHLPFTGRYLLILKANEADGGYNFFSPALEAAARELERRRGVTFDVMRVADADADSSGEYGKAVECVRRHLYSGVFVQHLNRLHGLDTILNLDYVPMAYFGSPSVFAQGKWVRSISSTSGTDDNPLNPLALQFKNCAAAGLRRIAVFASTPDRLIAAKAEKIARAEAKECGVEIEADGCHFTGMAMWHIERLEFVRLVRLYLRYIAGNPVDAIVLGDDNFLEPFEDACAEVYGARKKLPFAVFCHCNFPRPPKSRFGATFHGIDCTATLGTFVDYAEALLSGSDSPPTPHRVYA